MRIRLYMFQLARNAGCFTNNWTGFSSPKLSFDNELSQFRSFSQGGGSKNWSVRKLQSKLKMVEKQWEVCLSSAGSHQSGRRTEERSMTLQTWFRVVPTCPARSSWKKSHPGMLLKMGLQFCDCLWLVAESHDAHWMWHARAEEQEENNE
jgi:hypothetical protein